MKRGGRGRIHPTTTTTMTKTTFRIPFSKMDRGRATEGGTRMGTGPDRDRERGGGDNGEYGRMEGGWLAAPELADRPAGLPACLPACP